MKALSLSLLSVWLALPAMGWSATAGTSCNDALDIAGSGVSCIYLCTTIATAGTNTCGPIKVPFQNAKHATIRIYNPAFTDCGVDSGDVIALLRSSDSVTAGYRPIYGTLDDDSPVLEVKIYGPIDPYIGINGLVTSDATTECETALHGIDVIGLFYEDNPNQ